MQCSLLSASPNRGTGVKKCSQGTIQIVVSDTASPGEDLQLLASLKHFIYSHGTFGLWGILLSEAETVVYPEKANNTSKRYSHHLEFDILSRNLSETLFVTVDTGANMGVAVRNNWTYTCLSLCITFKILFTQFIGHRAKS